MHPARNLPEYPNATDIASITIAFAAAAIAATNRYLPTSRQSLDANVVHLTSPCPYRATDSARSSHEYLTAPLVDGDNSSSFDATVLAVPDLSVASPHQHPGAIHRASVHRAPGPSAPLGVIYITQALGATYITADDMIASDDIVASCFDAIVLSDLGALPTIGFTTIPAGRAPRTRTAAIPRSHFASRHSTSITNSRALPSSADADGPAGGRRYSATDHDIWSKL